MSPPSRPRRRPFSVLAKPVGSACNLRCAYCYFLGRDAAAAGRRMGTDLLRRYLAAYLDAQPDGEVVIAWQGGEPTLLGLDFFQEAVRLAGELARPRQRILHTLQTNGTFLDDDWARFLTENGFLVGLSIDGPARLHDLYRVDPGGGATHWRAMRGWHLLQKYGVETNILCAVNRLNGEHPLEVYRHFRDDLGAQYLQFIPVVEPLDAEHRASSGTVSDRSVTAEQWGRFLVTVFEEWLRHDVATVSVQHFDAVLAASRGQYTVCAHAPECGAALAMQPGGEVYSCDHYVDPAHHLGNIATQSFASMLASPKQLDFGRAKRTALPDQCRCCDVMWACHGGCPKDRINRTESGESDLNHLCAGYRRFFRHVMAALTE